MTRQKRKKVYFAAPLFSESEKKFNEDLTHKIESLGFTVFLPQRDGIEFATLKNLSSEEKNRRIYELDVRKVEGSDIIIALLDGRVPDEGVCVEMAIAKEYKKLTKKKKVIIGLKTDTRILLSGAQINPMILGNLDKFFNDQESLLKYISNNL